MEDPQLMTPGRNLMNYRPLPVALAICLLAGVIPAWNASRLKPVEAFRHE